MVKAAETQVNFFPKVFDESKATYLTPYPISLDP
jgi:hypothetical protein